MKVLAQVLYDELEKTINCISGEIFYDEMYFNFFGRNLYNNVLGSGHKVGLPKRKKEFRVIRSPHVNKKSMEYFKLETSKELYSFFDSSLFKVFSILLTHVFYFFKFFELKSKLNFIMVLRVWKKISKLLVFGLAKRSVFQGY